MPAGYFAPAMGLLCKIVSEYGRDPGSFFRDCGIPPTAVSDPRVRLPCETVERLWALVAETVADPCLGLRAADHLHPSHLGTLGYAWLASPSLRSALQRLARYINLLTEQREIRLRVKAGEVAVETHLEPTAQALPERADVALTALMTMCRWNFGPSLAPIAVSFKHAVNPCADRFEAFFRCPVQFGAQRNCILLRTVDVDAPLPSGNPQIAQISDQYLIDYLRRVERDDIISSAKGAIAEQLACGEVRVQDIADRLHLSVRTLQRRLGERQTSFGDLVDRARRELAESCLADPFTTITEIAFKTGFATQSGFTGAVRRWTGMAPSEYRRRMISAGRLPEG